MSGAAPAARSGCPLTRRSAPTADAVTSWRPASTWATGNRGSIFSTMPSRPRKEGTDMVKEFVDRAGWASVVGLCATAVTAAVFAVALVLSMLCEFIVTGGIGETVGESFVTTGGRICGALSLLAFVVGFVVGFSRNDAR